MAAKKNGKSGEIALDDATFFKGALLGALVLCGLVYGSESLRGVFLSEWGLFANLAVLFYLLAFVFTIKTIGIFDFNKWDKWKHLALLAMLALAMAAEELRWLIPFRAENPEEWPAQRIRDLISIAIMGVPEGATLWQAGLIAGTRLLLILMLLYGIGGAIYFRKNLLPLWRKFRAHKASLYALFFMVFLLLTIFVTAEMPALFALAGAYLRMGAGLSFFMMALQFRHK